MEARLTIPKSSETEASLDYRQLYNIGLRHVQRLSRRLWTDHNVHDPGITILELLSYALTDLSYRAAFPIEDLLAREPDSDESGNKPFFTARQILPNRPFTTLDYRKLLIDLKGVKNAWVRPATQIYYADKVKGTLAAEKAELPDVVEIRLSGLYDVILEFGEDIKSNTAKQNVIKEVWQRLHANRNLCEDFVSVTGVEEQTFLLCAELEVAPDADVAQIQAEIFYHVQHYAAPPIRNYSLSEMLERRTPDGQPLSVADIFRGPILDCGFFDDEELRQSDLRTELRLSDVISIIMDLKGVLAIRDIVMTPAPDAEPGAPGPPATPLENKWVIPVQPGKKVVLATDRSRLVFYKRQMPVALDRAKAEAAYTRLVEEERRKAETPTIYDLQIPAGRYRNPSSYYSFQNHFPAIYGLSDAGLSGAVDDTRKALAYQLKAYLLFFDQVMANYFAQLSHVKELFSADATVQHTYFAQVVDSFADYDAIYKTHSDEPLLAKLHRATEDQERFEGRRNRFLDHLIARFAEQFTDYAHMMYTAFSASRESLIATKCAFLQGYPAMSSKRAMAYDYSLKGDADLWDSDNVSGLEKRLAGLLGFPNRMRRNLGEIAFGVYAEIDGNPTDEFRFRIRNKETGDILLSSSAKYATPEQAKDAMRKVIRLAKMPERYQRKRTTDGRHYFNIVDATGDVLARRIEYFESKEIMDTAIAEVIRAMRADFSDEGMYVIENILLRPEKPTDPFLPICPAPDCVDCAELDPYSYRLHIILPADSARFSHMEFRRFVETVIREETPAHILPKICWVSEQDMKRFEKVYRDWIYLKSGKDTSGRKKKLEAMISTLYDIKNVYPMRLLHECDSPEDQPKFIVGQSALGTQRPPKS